MNFLKNQMTDANIKGHFELKIKARGISKSRIFSIDVEDPRWLQSAIFESKGPDTLNIEIQEGESKHNLNSYRVNAKIIQELPI